VKSLRTVWCHTIGCDKNLVDSEALLGRFRDLGVAITAKPEAADIWILNTCGFITAARDDSLATLAELAAVKGQQRLLAVVGCWSQEHGEEIRRRFPDVDVVAGVGQFDEIVSACTQARDAPATLATAPQLAHYPGLSTRHLLTPNHVAFVKISEGCNCSCTYCRIPMIRGPLRSRPVVEIVGEVQSLVAGGVQEIQLVSQNTSDFGRDRGEDVLALVRELNTVDGLRWIRLLYLHPGLIRSETLLQLLRFDKVVPYLDLPVQHASSRLLRAMKRPGDPEVSADFLLGLRQERPELILRSTVLLGFPGEREEDVEMLADFLARVEFDHLGTYRYSPEEGTAAEALPERVPDEVVADREALILDLQAEISLRRQVERLGEQHELVVDRVVPPSEERQLLESLAAGVWPQKRERNGLSKVSKGRSAVAIGRSRHFGYDLDGVVALTAGKLLPGHRVTVRFAGATAFDVWAVLTGSTSPSAGPAN